MLAQLLLVTAAGAPPQAAAALSPPAQCPSFGVKPEGCIAPPLQEQASLYNVWRELDGSHPSDAVIVRRPAMIGAYTDPVPASSFPAFIRHGPEGGRARFTLRLIIAADGTATSCAGVNAEAWSIGTEGSPRTDLAVDPALTAAGCTLVRSIRKFHPAIDVAGNPVEAPIDVELSYQRQRYVPSISPAPPPPSRFLGTQPYDRSKAWPPSYSLTEPVRITVPKFKDFLADRRDLPREAVVGVVMNHVTDGRPAGCEIKLPSGDARLDGATCAALMTSQAAPTRWQVRDLPIEVRWTRDKARMQMSGGAILPGLAAPIAIMPGDVPGVTAPKFPISVRVLLDEFGKPKSCTVIRPSYADAFDAASCRIVVAQARFNGGRDGFGRAAAGGVDLSVNWQKGSVVGSAF